jgi:predicted Zn-dependent protease with MMP-like domain
VTGSLDMTRSQFERLVAEALQTIPKRFRDEMHNVVVIVEPEPSAEILAEMEIPAGDTLYGLYQGTPLPERTWSDANRLPDRITIYQQPIEEDAEDEEDMLAIVAETVIHEFGHYFGLSEEEIEEIEERYWNGEDQDEGDDE